MSAPAELSGARALVLGAGGFLGRWTARALAAAGARVALVARDAAALEAIARDWDFSGRVLEADLSIAGEARRCVREVRPAVTFNLAGYGVDREERDPALFEALDERLPAELALALAEARDGSWTGTALLHAGSALEYGTRATYLSEDAEARPDTPYGRAKLAGTRALLEVARARGVPAIVARLFTVYGPGEHAGRLLPSLRAARAADADVPLTEGLQRRDFTYVEDVAEGLLRLARVAPGDAGGATVVHLATGRLESVRGFAELAAEALGLAPERLRFGALPGRADDTAHGPVDLSRLQRLIGWTPTTTIPEGVRRASAFEASRGTGGS